MSKNIFKYKYFYFTWIEAVILTGTKVPVTDWSQMNGGFCWINVFENTLISVSRPNPGNLYLDKNISILGGLEAEMLTRTQIWPAIL